MSTTGIWEWASWDDSSRIKENDRLMRDHAIAAASPRVGVALNRDIAADPFLRFYRRAIVHEFGHVLGIGHSPNRSDIMYPGSQQQVPSSMDLDTCNRAVEARFGVATAR